MNSGAEMYRQRRIALFTPLPPQKTGIANYSWDILQSMAKLCAVDVFVEDGCSPNIPPIPNCRLYPATAYTTPDDYDVTIFEIGNSPFHTYMLPFLRRHGGVVELHDANLNAWLFHDTVREKGDWAAYRAALLLDNPQTVVNSYIEAIQAGSPFDADGIMAFGFVTKYSHRLVVHNTYTKEQLLQRGFEQEIAVIPHYARAQKEFAQADVRKVLDIPANAVVFSSFGAVAQNRRLAAAIYALKRLEQEVPLAHLYITGGDDWGTLYDCKALVRYLGLQDRVHFTGRLEDTLFWQYLAASDVVLSLRWPYRGESSGVMCQTLAVGKPQIVTDVGCFGELPAGVSLKLPPPDLYTDEEAEGELLAVAMGLLAKNPARRQRMGKAAKKYAQTDLQPDDMAKRILYASNGEE